MLSQRTMGWQRIYSFEQRMVRSNVAWNRLMYTWDANSVHVMLPVSLHRDT